MLLLFIVIGLQLCTTRWLNYLTLVSVHGCRSRVSVTSGFVISTYFVKARGFFSTSSIATHVFENNVSSYGSCYNFSTWSLRRNNSYWTYNGASGNWLVVEGRQQSVRYQDELEVLGEIWVVSALSLFGTSSVLPITLLKVFSNSGEGGLTRIMWKQRPGWSYAEVLQDWIWPALLLPPLLSKDPFKPVMKSRVGHLMIAKETGWWMKLACAQKTSRFLTVPVILPLDTIISGCSPSGSGGQPGSRVGLSSCGEARFFLSVSLTSTLLFLHLLSISLCCCYLDRPVKISVVNLWWPSPSLEHLFPLNFGSCTGLRLWRIASCCGGGYSVLRNGSKPSHPAEDMLRAAAATCDFGLMFFARLLSALLRHNFSSE